MIRFTVGKKEKKLRTKMRRDELSNLNVISGGFGTVGAGIDDAFGNDDDGSGDSDGDDKFQSAISFKRCIEAFNSSFNSKCDNLCNAPDLGYDNLLKSLRHCQDVLDPGKDNHSDAT